MKEYSFICPCCGEQLKISVDSSGNATAFLLDKIPISQEKLSEDFGIELGIVESSDNLEE